MSHKRIWGCVKRFLPPTAAEYYFETDVFFMILLRKIMKNTSVSNLNLARSAMKSVSMALRAKLPLDGDIFFLILRSKIKKKMSPSKKSFAAAGGKRLFTQPLPQINKKKQFTRQQIETYIRY